MSPFWGANPAGDTYTFTYEGDESGLLDTMRLPASDANDPNEVFSYDYDAVGRLTSRTDTTGKSTTYGRTEPDVNTFVVTATTPEGQVTAVESSRSSDGAETTVTTHPDGTQTTVVAGADLKCTVTLTEGTLITLTPDADPRFGTAELLPSNVVVTLPDTGSLAAIGQTETVTLADPRNPMSLRAFGPTGVSGLRPYRGVTSRSC